MALETVKLFGFEFGEKKEPIREVPKEEQPFVSPREFEGTTVIDTIGALGGYGLNFAPAQVDGRYNQANDNINTVQYRNMSSHPELDTAISEIVDAMVVIEPGVAAVEPDLTYTGLSDAIKGRVHAKFQRVMRLMDFQGSGYDIVRRWYVDSRMYYAIIVDPKAPRKGISKLIPLDPLKISKKTENLVEPTSIAGQNIPLVKATREFFVYTNTDRSTPYVTPAGGLMISPDNIAYVHSGLIDYNTKRIIGYLHKAIRPLNMLRQLEDALLVYRIARAPERRAFYIDIGNMNGPRANEYINEMRNQFRNRVSYNPHTGEIKSERHHLSVLEDLFIPRREGSRGTEIQTLPPGNAMNQIEDVLLIQRTLYQSLNIPVDRLASENGFNMGRSVEISREEVKFYKFVGRLRHQFSKLFLALLRVEVLLSGIMTEADWKRVAPTIVFKWNTDNYFGDLKELEIMRERVQTAALAEPFVGRYISSDFVKRRIFNMTDQDIEREDVMMIDDKRRMQVEFLRTSAAVAEQGAEDSGPPASG